MIRPYTEKDFTSFHLCAVKPKDGKGKCTITGCTDKDVQISIPAWVSYADLLKYFTFLDGSPCGIEEEEE